MWKIDGGLHSSQRTQRAEDTSREILALFRKKKKKRSKYKTTGHLILILCILFLFGGFAGRRGLMRSFFH